MSLKKPSVPALTGAAGSTKPAPTTLVDAFNFPDENWTQVLLRSVEPTQKETAPPTNTMVEDPREKMDHEKQTLFVTKPDYSTLNTPVMTPVLSNTPENESPLTKMLKTEGITELTLPVVYEDPNPTTVPVDNMFPAEFDQLWQLTSSPSFCPDPFQCVNPRDAEGIQVPDFEIDEGIDVMEEFSFSPMLAANAGFENTDLIPATIEDGMANMTVDQRSLQTEPEAMEFDLLQFVVDETIAADTALPFQTIKEEDVDNTPEIAEPLPSTSAQADLVQTYTVEVTTVKKKGRGRPPKTTPGLITPRPGRTTGSSRSSDHIYVVRSEDRDTQRYRRMRDLNNEASRRCRQNRKSKFFQLEIEREQLEKKNKALKFKLQKMEEIVSTLKQKFISDISNPAAQKKTTAPATVVSADLVQDFGFIQQNHVTPMPVPAVAQVVQEPTNFPDLLDMESEWSGIN